MDKYYTNTTLFYMISSKENQKIISLIDCFTKKGSLTPIIEIAKKVEFEKLDGDLYYNLLDIAEFEIKTYNTMIYSDDILKSLLDDILIRNFRSMNIELDKKMSNENMIDLFCKKFASYPKKYREDVIYNFAKVSWEYKDEEYLKLEKQNILDSNTNLIHTFETSTINVFYVNFNDAVSIRKHVHPEEAYEFFPVIFIDDKFDINYIIDYQDIMTDMALIITDFVGDFGTKILPTLKQTFGDSFVANNCDANPLTTMK